MPPLPTVQTFCASWDGTRNANNICFSRKRPTNSKVFLHGSCRTGNGVTVKRHDCKAVWHGMTSAKLVRTGRERGKNMCKQ